MKKLNLIGLFIIASASTSVLANTMPVNNSYGGFSGPSQAQNTVKSIGDSGPFNDDMPVTLSGYITSSNGGELYTFSDGTGEITVEIDYEDWRGLKVNPETKIILSGEVDRDFTGTKVDVDSIRAAN